MSTKTRVWSVALHLSNPLKQPVLMALGITSVVMDFVHKRQGDVSRKGQEAWRPKPIQIYGAKDAMTGEIRCPVLQRHFGWDDSRHEPHETLAVSVSVIDKRNRCCLYFRHRQIKPSLFSPRHKLNVKVT